MGDMLRSRATRLAILVALITAVYAAAVRGLFNEVDALDRPVVESALALGAGILLAVRLNRAYERWWEARTVWGELVNTCRDLALKVRAYARPDADEARQLVALIAGFPYALRDHLREGATLQHVDGFEDEPEAPEHVPLWLAGRIFERLAAWGAEGRTRPEQLLPLDLEARELMQICGACERIRGTLMPPSLAAVTSLLILVVIAALPWVLHDDGSLLYVVLVSALTAFFLIVVETMASVLERPFDGDVNQLRLTPLCDTIRRTVGQALDPSPTSTHP